jgi:DNA topoisomerase-1
MGSTEAHKGLTPPEGKGNGSKKNAAPIQRKGKMVIVESPAKARTVGNFLGKITSLKHLSGTSGSVTFAAFSGRRE